MKLGKTLYVTSASQWRSWLRKYYKTRKEIWLIYYKKHTGKRRIPYNDAVDEALCYGWIDGIVKRIDDERFTQRFTPRREGSLISEMNKERVRRLIKKKKMTRAGMESIKYFFNGKEKFSIKPDILKALKENKKVWANFQKFPLSYKRVRIGYIESQRAHDMKMFDRSLNNFLRMTAKNKKFGMVK